MSPGSASGAMTIRMMCFPIYFPPDRSNLEPIPGTKNITFLRTMDRSVMAARSPELAILMENGTLATQSSYRVEPRRPESPSGQLISRGANIEQGPIILGFCRGLNPGAMFDDRFQAGQVSQARKALNSD